MAMTEEIVTTRQQVTPEERAASLARRADINAATREQLEAITRQPPAGYTAADVRYAQYRIETIISGERVQAQNNLTLVAILGGGALAGYYLGGKKLRWALVGAAASYGIQMLRFYLGMARY